MGDVVESFPCAFMLGDEVVRENLTGFRASEHFAFIGGALTHIPSGFRVPFTQCWNLSQAKERAACLEALSFMDWKKKDPHATELDEQQAAHLREAALGTMPPKEWRHV